MGWKYRIVKRNEYWWIQRTRCTWKWGRIWTWDKDDMRWRGTGDSNLIFSYPTLNAYKTREQAEMGIKDVITGYTEVVYVDVK